MTSVPSHIPLTLGIVAGTLFVLLFATALIVTMRNRRKIRRFSNQHNKE